LKLNNLTESVGKRFARLVVIRVLERDRHGRVQWLCRCDCGIEKVIRASHVSVGATRSCGCLRTEEVILRMKTQFLKHGMEGTPIYSVWGNMKDRCNNSRNRYYADYGGRGIKFCDEWKEFEPFMRWAFASGYRKGLTLDRIDNDLGYSPSNCRWSEWIPQANNKRNNVILEYNGERRSIARWAALLSVPDARIRQRIVNGWSPADALTKPSQRPNLSESLALPVFPCYK
jgi:hypothetical protein